MKNNITVKLSSALLSAAMLTAISVGCSKENIDTQTGISSDIPASYTAELNYYKSALAELEDELLKNKEESFIMQTELQNRIDSLQQQLNEAKSEKNDPPTTGTPSAPDNPSSDNVSLITPYVDFSIQSSDSGFSILAYTGSAASITVPSSISGAPVTKIADSAFKNSSLEEINISEGVTSIGWFAFEGASKLTRVSLPASLTTIGYGAFDNCPKSMIIVCPRGSYAEAYAQSWGLNYISE